MSSSELPVSFLEDPRNVVVTKEMLKSIQIIGQVDSKYIASTLKIADARYLIIFDQHAVDERLRLEHFQNKYKHERNDLQRTKLSYPILLTVKIGIENILSDLRELEKTLESSEIICFIKQDTDALLVSITEFPLLLLRKIIRRSSYQDYVDYVKEAVTKIVLHHVAGGGSSCTNLFNQAFASEACTRAVKFGDVLDHRTMMNMLIRLANCDMPFQCAHGRPSLTVISQFPQNTKSLPPPKIQKITSSKG